jgi:tetratricopeptide (TPR) repeat protein
MPFLSNPLVLDKHVEEGMIETQRFIHDLEIEAKSPAAQTSDEFTKALDELSAESANLTIVDDPSQPIKKLHIAEGHYKKALQDAKQKQDKVGMIAAYESLGKVTAGAGDFDKAIKYINKQLALAKELDHTESQQKGMFQLGLTAAELGEPEKAVSSFEEALDIAQKRDDRVSQVRILQKLSESYLLTKQFDKAASAQQDYIQMSREIGVKLLGGTRPIQAPQLDNAHYSFTSPATGLHTPSSLAASTAPNSSPVVNGFVMVVSVLCSMLRNLREPQAKLTCLDTFNRVAPYVDDEVRLQRLVPFAVSLLAADSRDQSALVRAQAIKTLANIVRVLLSFIWYYFSAHHYHSLNPDRLICADEPRSDLPCQRCPYIPRVSSPHFELR